MGYDASLVYPDRKRCARCRSYFCWEVIFGLFCSRECAEIPPISVDPEDWPRCHYSVVKGGRRKAKLSFLSVRSANRHIKKSHPGRQKTIYRCDYCWELHIGSPDPGKVYSPHPQMPL